MPYRFIALPVSQGDAFYLERDDWSVLVDGGLSKQFLPDLFRRETGKCRVNVLVCTHNDADHANGVLGFLESSLCCDEVWLPGRWLETLPSVLRSWQEVEHVFFARPDMPTSDIVETSGEAPTRTRFEVFADSLDADEFASTVDAESVEIPSSGWPESMVSLLENAPPWREGYHGEYWHPYRLINRDDFFRSAMEAAARIRDIALAAFHRGIPVRWFEYEPGNPSGGTALLRPVNAQQIARVARVARVARITPVDDRCLFLLAHTVANKKSLVFCSPRADESPAVLFTADSDLANTTMPCNLTHAIVTAPHHGSDANAKAYDVVTNSPCTDTDSLNWVRSDGRYRSRPGPEFLKQPKRFCTMCRKTSTCFTNKQAVELRAQSGSWSPAGATCSCS